MNFQNDSQSSYTDKDVIKEFVDMSFERDKRREERKEPKKISSKEEKRMEKQKALSKEKVSIDKRELVECLEKIDLQVSR